MKNLISMFNRIVKLPHRPNEENVRKIYEMLDIPIPPGTLSAQHEKTILHYLPIKQCSTTALRPKDDSHALVRI